MAAPLLGGWLLTAGLLAVSRFRESPRSRLAACVVIFGLAQFLPIFALEAVYDRYLVVILPAMVIAGFSWSWPRRRAVIAGVLTLIVAAALSVEWTRAYVDRATTHWEVASELVARGVQPHQIDTDFAWHGLHLYLEVIQSEDPEIIEWEGPYPWSLLVTGEYTVREWPAGQRQSRPGQVVLVERFYRPFLSRRLHWVGVVDNQPL